VAAPIVEDLGAAGAGVPEARPGARVARPLTSPSRRARGAASREARSRLLALLRAAFREAVEARAPSPTASRRRSRVRRRAREDPYAAADALFEGVVRDAGAAGRRHDSRTRSTTSASP
jgi:hypothetical protein